MLLCGYLDNIFICIYKMQSTEKVCIYNVKHRTEDENMDKLE